MQTYMMTNVMLYGMLSLMVVTAVFCNFKDSKTISIIKLHDNFKIYTLINDKKIKSNNEDTCIFAVPWPNGGAACFTLCHRRFLNVRTCMHKPLC